VFGFIDSKLFFTLSNRPEQTARKTCMLFATKTTYGTTTSFSGLFNGMDNSRIQYVFTAARPSSSTNSFFPIGVSRGIQRPASFGKALVQNIASGNSMVMSHAVLIAQQKVNPEHSVWHDWTTYLVATATGGVVWFGGAPSLLYRQHVANVIVANAGLKAQIKRIKPLLQGRLRKFSEVTVLATQDIYEPLT
jgi:hypothetical protein